MSRSFVSDNTPLPAGAFRRPSSSGLSGGFATGGTPNTALFQSSAPAGQLPRPVHNVPNVSVGLAGNANNHFMSNPATLGQQSTGAGGESDAARAAIARFMPNMPSQMTGMPGSHPSFNSHDASRSEQGVQAFSGFGDKISPFVRNILPTQRTDQGMAFAGFGARPTKLDSEPSIGGSRGTGDPRVPNSLFSDGQMSVASPFMMDAFMRAREAPDTTQTEGTAVNATLPYAHVLRPFSRDSSLQPRQFDGLVMLLCRSDSVTAYELASTSRDGSIGTPKVYNSFLSGNSNKETIRSRHTEMSISLFNYIQAATQKVEIQGHDEDDYIRKLLDEWTVHGIAIGDQGGRKRRRNGVSDRANQQGFERAVLSAVQGETMALNIWGDEAGNGNTRLFLILKRVPREDLYKVVAESTYDVTGIRELGDVSGVTYRVAPESQPVHINAATLTKSPFQLIPYAHRGSKPIPPDVYEYEFDAEKYNGAIIEVARSHYPLGSLQQQNMTGALLSSLGNGLPDEVKMRKIQMFSNLSTVNDANNMINSGQLMVHVNVSVRIPV